MGNVFSFLLFKKNRTKILSDFYAFFSFLTFFGDGRGGYLYLNYVFYIIYIYPSIKEDDIYLKFGHLFGKTDRQTDILVYREVTLPKILNIFYIFSENRLLYGGGGSHVPNNSFLRN